MRRSRMISEEVIDRTLSDTFPASDPPFWTLGIERARHFEQTERDQQKRIIPDNESKELLPPL